MNLFQNDTLSYGENKDSDLISLKDASLWASAFLKKSVSTSNIAYLVQYGLIHKKGLNGTTLVSRTELQNYYQRYSDKRKSAWNTYAGKPLNWALSFEEYKEAETTKHVHRLHPYKGKYIPQLVEYFLDDHMDDFKKEIFFQKNDIVIDPFVGSGTTLVQASELGMHGVGIDVSPFNCFLTNCKLGHYNLLEVERWGRTVTHTLKTFLQKSNLPRFEEELTFQLAEFNQKNFPVPDYKFQLKRGLINEEIYGLEKEKEFLVTYEKLVKKYSIQLRQSEAESFLEKWFSPHIRTEIDLAYQTIQTVPDISTRNILSLILSRTVRSCRATTHADLATLKEPVTSTYYCSKHGKICKPLCTINKWWETYTKDTVKRLREFEALRSNSLQIALHGNSSNVDVIEALKQECPMLAEKLNVQKARGIFSSPPYVGLIDYHEQHAYAYELLGFPRKDDWEIGKMSEGQGAEAKAKYVRGIADVLNHCKKYLCEEYHVFLVANDKHGLYPEIAKRAGMKIVQEFQRPVLNRTERDKSAYSETIFHLQSA